MYIYIYIYIYIFYIYIYIYIYTVEIFRHFQCLLALPKRSLAMSVWLKYKNKHCFAHGFSHGSGAVGKLIE